MLPLQNIYLFSPLMSGNPRQAWILDSTPWILVQVWDSGCFVSGTGIPDSNRYWDSRIP